MVIPETLMPSFLSIAGLGWSSTDDVVFNFHLPTALVQGNCLLDNLVLLKMLRTTGLAVRNTSLNNIPKGFSSEMTLEVA